VKWDDIQGLEDVKKVLKETIVLPTMRPDIFKGILSPAKGILLYGPPGNGKTLLAKAIASECQSTFFSCSAVTLTSKWMGESEKLVKALFALAYEREPAVIFIDEIDSIMGSRGGNEHESSRRLKTEFLVQFDGVNSNSDKKVLVLAATNRPGDLDEACLRRLTRRIYMPLPDIGGRLALLQSRMKDVKHSFTEEDFSNFGEETRGYSMADLSVVVKEIAMMPIREMATDQLLQIKDMNDIRPVGVKDMAAALRIV
jgi:spastin